MPGLAAQTRLWAALQHAALSVGAALWHWPGHALLMNGEGILTQQQQRRESGGVSPSAGWERRHGSHL